MKPHQTMTSPPVPHPCHILFYVLCPGCYHTTDEPMPLSDHWQHPLCFSLVMDKIHNNVFN
jgi:hypothetical protein